MLEGGTTLHWVNMQKFRSVLCPNIGGSRMIVELKMGGDKKKHTIWALLLSLLALTTNF